MNDNLIISYIIPTYQAESFIQNNLDLFFNYCTDSNFRYEIIIVNDGSTDRTNEIVENYLKEKEGKWPVKYINLEQNMGKGSAIIKGLEAAEGEYILFTDCDLPYSFKNMNNLIDNLVNGNANVVIANRMHPDSVYSIKSKNISYIYVRHTAGRLFNKLVKLITGLNIEDTQAGLKGFDRKTADIIFKRMTITGFTFDVDLLMCAKEQKKKIVTIPIDYNYEHEVSTIRFIQQSFAVIGDLSRIFVKRLTGYYRK